MNVLDSFSLKGKVALLTGGAGMYGRQIAEALAEAGATTIVASRNLAELEKVAAELRAADGDVTALPLDLEDHSQTKRAFRCTRQQCSDPLCVRELGFVDEYV